MTKKGIRYCDKCGVKLELIDFTQQDINPHDIVTLGYKTKTGRVLNKNYDLCKEHMDVLDEYLNTKVTE
jgi:hypothetical protein